MAVPTLARGEPGKVGTIAARRVCPGHPAAGRLAKRAFDMSTALVLLAVAMPLLAVLAVVLRRRCGSPVLFRQLRVTRGGRSAVIVKLRTLREHRDADTRWSVPEQRLAPLAQWLRDTHLDELPQLINVLRGDMSLVGPRPERPYFSEMFSREVPGYASRHRMRAGLTGWAQVNGLNGDTSIAERVRFDNYYIDNWSLRFDLKILAQTIGVMARAARGTSIPVSPLPASQPGRWAA
jgi:lipopolysaccharide/colanic/teichoic acid biosynthesis glycosyltransferase